MKIISETVKGKKILEPKDIKTRTLKDLTKESIFNILNHSNKFKINLENTDILDLYSGVGSFGIECLSRGVKSVIFVENYNGVLPVLKQNLQNLKDIDNYTVSEKDINNVKAVDTLDLKFDIVCMYPPYKDTMFNLLLNNLVYIKILHKIV